MNDDLYLSNGNEVQLFEWAYAEHMPVMLTGPTGCGKTRFVEHMGHLLGRPVITISCHDDLTSADLVGRFMVTGGDVVWTDGPLTTAVSPMMMRRGHLRFEVLAVGGGCHAASFTAPPQSPSRARSRAHHARYGPWLRAPIGRYVWRPQLSPPLSVTNELAMLDGPRS